MSNRWKGSRIFEQTFDILSPCRNLNTVNGAPSASTPSTCLNPSFTYALPPGVAHTHSRDPDHCFFCKQLCPLPRCCYWWRFSSGTHGVWSCSLCTADTLKPCLWNLYSTTQTLVKESHIIPQRCIPAPVCSRLALLKLLGFKFLKYFFHSSFSFSISFLNFQKLIAASFSQMPLILLRVYTLRRARSSPMTHRLFSLLLLGSHVNVNCSSPERLIELSQKLWLW